MTLGRLCKRWTGDIRSGQRWLCRRWTGDILHFGETVK